MNILQANVRSLNTTKDLLEITQVTHQAKLVLLQEVWNTRNNTHLKDFIPPVMKVRDNNRGGGVAIYVHCSAKLVPLRCYEVDNLEAVWAKVMVGNISCVVGSVYIYHPVQLIRSGYLVNSSLVFVLKMMKCW